MKDWLEEQKVVWVLVREDASAMLAAPLGIRVERFLLPSGDAPRTVPDCVQVLRSVLPARNLGLRGAVVSVPRGLREARVLEADLTKWGARALDSEEHRALDETGMGLPFGDWASSEHALLYWISASAFEAATCQ